MAQYPVFTSYAQADRDDHLEKFVREFRKQFQSLTGRNPPAGITFLDYEGIVGGAQWEPEILERSAQGPVGRAERTRRSGWRSVPGALSPSEPPRMTGRRASN